MKKLVKGTRPTDPVQWVVFCRRALARAKQAKDPRVTALQEALNANNAERTLRRMSLICDADLDREFPVP